MDELTGILKKIKWQNPSNFWGVFLFQFPSIDHLVTVTGELYNPACGAEYKVQGDWETHKTYGRQFAAKSFRESQKKTAEGIIAYLCSKAVPGVGPTTAKAIVDTFGLSTLDIIRSDEYMQLTTIAGIGAATAQKLHNLMPQEDVREDLRMLLGKDITDKFIGKIIARYGNNAVGAIKSDPYRLIEDFNGIGFFRADKIAKAIGISDNAPQRIRAAIYYYLTSEAELNGHCFSYCSNLQVNLQELIPNVSIEAIANAIKDLSTDKQFKKMALHVDSDGAIYLKWLYTAETKCAEIIKEHITTQFEPKYTPSIVATASKRIQKISGILPEETQQRAVLESLNKKLSVITGGPGTGKTTIIKTIIEAAKINYPNVQIALMAPTGRASVRMKDVTGMPATTIHKRIRYNMGDVTTKKSTPSPDSDYTITEDIVIIDESSMIDIYLAYCLLSSIQPNAQIIFIGDVDQLPPVGPGTFFRDLVSSYRVPTTRLKLSFRQKGLIAQNAAKINYGEGVHSYVTDNDTFSVITASKATGPRKAVEQYLKLRAVYGDDETILLSATRKRGEGGTDALNAAIQAKVNPHTAAPEIKNDKYVFRINDRVMMQSNNWSIGLTNGDTGTIKNITPSGVVVVQFDNAVIHEFSAKEFIREFSLAYACTVHKSQGSEYKSVVFLFTGEHTFMGERNIVYTAVTRAKESLKLVCDARALNRAIDTVKPLNRNSKLKERINTL